MAGERIHPRAQRTLSSGCDDTWNAGQRGETPLKRADRNFAELLFQCGLKRELVWIGHRFIVAGMCGLLSAIVGGLLLVIDVCSVASSPQ